MIGEWEWKINANGYEGNLKLTSIDLQGKLHGTVYGNPIFGFWDEVSKKITFMRLCEPNDPSTFQIYTGYLFTNPIKPDAGGTLTYTLTGFFEAFSGTGGVAQRVLYGWFARVTIIG